MTRHAPLLELCNATVVKNGTRVLDGLTMTIEAGQHTAILGPNGSGKTSLIHLLTHDHYPLADERQPPIRVFGADRWNVEELRSTLGIVTTDLHQQFVEGHSAGRIRGIDAVISGFFATRGFLINRPVTSDMGARAASMLETLEAGRLATRRLDEMSTGEARRVLIARALVTGPRALVLDEPTSGLDLVARGAFLETISRIARAGTTIVLVTHHVEEIVPEIDHVVLLQRGRVAGAGTKREVLTGDRLSDLFGARIVLDERDGYYHARAAGGSK